MQHGRVALKLITPAAEDALAVADLKAYLKITTNSEDALLASLIDAATAQLEELTGRSFVNSSWAQFLDCWPGTLRFNADNWNDGWREGALASYLETLRHIELLRYPLVSVESLKTYGIDDTEFTADSAIYQADTFTEPGRLALRPGYIWPSTVLRSAAGIRIDFTAGYGANAAAMPAWVTNSIMALAAYKYSNRGCEGEAAIPPSVIALVNPYILKRV